jgi:hypothetical protein
VAPFSVAEQGDIARRILARRISVLNVLKQLCTRSGQYGIWMKLIVLF